MSVAISQAPKKPPSSNLPRRTASECLDSTTFMIGRAYYNYVLLLEDLLLELGLERHISPGMGNILFALYEQDDRIIRDLAARVRLSSSTMTAILERMHKAGLIERRRDDGDGRAVRVRLTPLAHSIAPKCWKVVERLNEVIHAGMTPREIEQLKFGLERMVENLRVRGLRVKSGSFEKHGTCKEEK